MNRREALGAMAAAIAVPAMGQQICAGTGKAATDCSTTTMSGTVSPGLLQLMPDQIPIEERKRQYAICKERGHAPEYLSSLVTNAIWPPPPPPNPICKYCGTEIWTETIQHEKGAPE
jgi:hypothetical protein